MTAVVPRAQVGTLATFARPLQSLIEGGDDKFVQQQLARLGAALTEMQLLTPQSATAVPKTLRDGMVRLSRDPWRPVSGQTTDQWVYWDAAGQLWRLLATAPTNT